MSSDPAAAEAPRDSVPDAGHAAEGPAPGPTLDRLPVGVYRTSPEGRMLYANDALADLLGYPDPESLMAVPVPSHYVDPEARDRWTSELRETDFVHRHEIQVVRRDGSTIWVSHTTRTVRDDEGEVLWFEGIMEDAEELHRLREERERSARLLNLLEEVASAANATSDPEEIFRLVLRQVCELTGWPVGHVYLVSDQDPDVLWPSNLWHLDDPERFQRLVDVTTVNSFPRGVSLPGRVLETREAVWIPDLADDDGFVRSRQEPNIGVRGGFGFPVLVGDEVVAVFEFFSPEIAEPDEGFLDLTVRVGAIVGRVVERARAARQMDRLHDELENRVQRRTAELAASVQELEAFTYSVSHDLRAPLRALDGFSQALMEDYGEELDETGKDYLGRVRRASQRMGDLIDDLLRLSRISRRSLEPEIVDLSELCRETLRELAEMDRERSVTVEVEDGLQVWG
ncbi:MAG: histidine kinase dimerization/phospho-acceptor domain-containing protein, partial [Longimicrobiales bacterium]|nr:histidine kinase dimerization/phospho-acceptor domain-containing protein [Longimicrobiales bacterium]